jgi:flagellar hook-length control protein FliK
MRRLLKIDSGEVKPDGTSSSGDALSATGLPGKSDGVVKVTQVQSVKIEADVLQVSSASVMPKGQAQNGIDGTPKLFSASVRTLDESVMQQLTQKIPQAVRAGMHEIRIHLKPEALGDVKVRIQVEGDKVTARIQVESQQVKAIVESNMPQLRNALEQHNLQAGTLDVSVESGMSDARHAREEAEAQNRKASQSGEHEAGEKHENSIAESITGTDTGRLYGSNSVEYFA